jgi:hypothetical protein
MIKNLLALLATSASLAAMLFIANTADAAPLLEHNATTTVSAPAIAVVSLNLTPSLNLTSQQNNPIVHNLGCACAVCSGSSRQPSLP